MEEKSNRDFEINKEFVKESLDPKVIKKLNKIIKKYQKYYMEFKFLKAKFQVEKGIKLLPDRVENLELNGYLHLILGDLNMLLNNVDEAISNYEVAKKSYMNKRIFFQLGRAYKKKDLKDMAIYNFMIYANEHEDANKILKMYGLEDFVYPYIEGEKILEFSNEGESFKFLTKSNKNIEDIYLEIMNIESEDENKLSELLKEELANLPEKNSKFYIETSYVYSKVLLSIKNDKIKSKKLIKDWIDIIEKNEYSKFYEKLGFQDLLAFAYVKLGENKKALNILEKCQEKNPYDLTNEAKDLLEELKKINIIKLKYEIKKKML